LAVEGEGLETGGWISPAEHTSEVAAAWDRAADREAEVMEGYLKDLQEGREPEEHRDLCAETAGGRIPPR
jgi:hypothetical protein